MARTALDYVKDMRHALGKVPDARNNLWQRLNEAGRALVNSHPWTWRTRGPVALERVEGQSFVTLPADFEQAIDLIVPESLSFRCIQTSIQDLNARRSANQFDNFVLYIAFPFGDDQVNTQEPVTQRRAEIFPTPAATDSDVQLVYTAGWREIEDDDQSSVPNVPLTFERALGLMCRMFAMEFEDQLAPYEKEALYGPGGDSLRVTGGELGRLMMADGNRQTDQGQPLGGTYRGRRGGRLYPHRSIGGR
jgi:hypothetical protein